MKSQSTCDRFYAAACQVDFPPANDRTDIAPRVARMLEMIDSAVTGYEPFFDVRLVVFPEFAHAAPVYATVSELLSKLALPIPNEHTDRYVAKARQYGIYIQTGTFLEADPLWPGHVFNTTCLIGPDGLLAKYRKVHTWLPWEISTSPHDLPNYDKPLFPVVETEIGRIGAAICYDWLFPEAIRQLAIAGAEILIRVSAYMDPWGTASPMDWWTLVNRTRAIENVAYVVAANQGATLAHYPPFSWPGGSMIVDFDGRILAQAEPGPGERIVVGPVDLAALRSARERRRGHAMLSHLRTEAYAAYAHPVFPAGRAAHSSISKETNETATEQASARLEILHDSLINKSAAKTATVPG
ncbi:MAG TPA: nitrilase-related carbon-nitrogen hydrolase [Verrucomicrobiota bacterium]|mgnify:CR=1 FL=1|nr:nitrilase-related carbon-nitrogen hydrolase [Verrucomicrobiota bacterium]